MIEWDQLNERRLDLLLKADAEGLTEEEQSELRTIQELLVFYFDHYVEQYSFGKSDLQLLRERHGIN